jgi:hypothetical protein
MFNGRDADVIITSIKYAVSWNGVWHNKPIFGEEWLKKNQERDNRKHEEIIKCGYEHYVINDPDQYNKKFVEEQFAAFLGHLEQKR